MGQLGKCEARVKRKRRIRKRAKSAAGRPRLTVFRSSKHIYAQIIDDLTGKTLVSASSREKEFADQAKEAEGAHGNNLVGAGVVGKLLGNRAKSKNVAKIVFDRNGYLYHGRVKALAESVRETGVDF